MKQQKNLALFDLDYTLIEADCEALWSQFMFEKGKVGKEFVERIDQYYRDYEEGWLDLIEYEEYLLHPLTLYPLETLCQLREEFLERIRPLIRPVMQQRID